jgi:tetratricopeptide (TPR) repeat protein
MRSSSLNITNEPPSIWSFDSLFPDPVLDEISIKEDLYGSKRREEELAASRERRKERDERVKSASLIGVDAAAVNDLAADASEDVSSEDFNFTMPTLKDTLQQPQPIDKTLTRMVQDRIYGLTRTPGGSIQYSTSLMDSSRAVQFRDGRRLGKPLAINLDRLNYFAKKDFSHGKLEEAQEYYLEALGMDPTDGRAYLGMSRIAQRRGDLEYARQLLRQGIQRCGGDMWR